MTQENARLGCALAEANSIMASQLTQIADQTQKIRELQTAGDEQKVAPCIQSALVSRVHLAFDLQDLRCILAYSESTWEGISVGYNARFCM